MITITPHKLTGILGNISSKSLSHRYVIASALSNEESILYNVLDSEDLVATKNALRDLGALIDGNRISGGYPVLKNPVINANESGSTLRFFIPIAMLQEKEVTFIGKGRLMERPLDVFADMFKNKNIAFRHELGEKVIVKGKLMPGTYEMRGDVSSQFLTGLLYALPLLKDKSIIKLTTPLESKGYVDLTIDVLKKYGIKIDVSQDTYTIEGNQSYKPGSYTVEGDYSQAAFFIVAATLGEKITLKHLNPESLQGDKDILNVLKNMGGDFVFTSEGLEINPAYTKGTTINLEQIPDLGPILMVLASLSEGKTEIINAKRLRIKESDRLEAMYQELSKMGVKMDVYEDRVTIYGQKTLKGNVTLHTHNDHRIAMALAIASIKADGPVTLDDETVVKKSYPNFFEDFKFLGGIFK